ncbi:MAG: isochorismate synthase [Acidimicrobiia bacterium]
MAAPDDPRVIWSQGGASILGYGGERHDPGTGPGRYEVAAALLRSSGQDLAFASFTFDPQDEGSVVVIPEEVVSTPIRGIPSRPGSSSRLRVVSDGIEQWRGGMERIREALAEGSVEKVVLARQVEIEVDPGAHLPTLARRLGMAGKSSYTFLVEGLAGASPELLVSLRDGRLTSLALAGTSADQRALASPKMRREHAFAVESVKAGLERHLRSPVEGSEERLAFGAIHHLGTRLRGKAAPGTEVTGVLADLHPTAGLAGTPRSAALDLIREIEPRSRGRYAGPVGWFTTSGEGEFAVALRCGLVDGRQAILYAGGGIVRGSDPEEELAETELKLGPMISALSG